MPQDTLHDIQMSVQKGTGLLYNLCLICHPPVGVLDNLWHQTRLFKEFYHSLWVWAYTVTCFHFSQIFPEVYMANHYYSVCCFLHLFMEWQKSPSSDKECSNW